MVVPRTNTATPDSRFIIRTVIPIPKKGNEGKIEKKWQEPGLSAKRQVALCKWQVSIKGSGAAKREN